MSVNEQLLELEDLLWKANREGDGDFYEKYLLDDAIAVTKFGIIDKATAVPGITANVNPYLKTDRTGERVIVVDDHTAIVTYRVEVTVLVDGDEAQFPAYASTVWTDVSGEWRIAFHQQTAL
ncbi:nuclear transport factor 2 family protein [Kribbella sp. NBC_00709]|uniref:nuclear transport factor 2 family protein n=1 Tax=Kribbella sp. NBC_00709 TaxID=2975972 RepID=UPI002E293D51|nr:nuclear transport factor 2 family protein [Kribbella sp. NBC_00709]